MAGWWKAAIAKGLGADVGIELHMVYYGQHLVPADGQGANAPERLGEGAQQLVMRWGHLLGAPDEVAQGWLTAPSARW